MSSSKGIVLLPGDMLDIMPPDALRRMVLGRDPARALALDLADGFPRFMDEYRADTEEKPVPFTHLVTIVQTTGGDPDRAAEMLWEGGYEEAAKDTDKLRRDLTYVRNWARDWAPESLRLGILEPLEAAEAVKGLDENQLHYLEQVAGKLENGMDGDAVQNLLYSTAVELGLKPKKVFAAVYTVLLGRKNGPKAGPFIASLGVDAVRERFLSVSGDT